MPTIALRELDPDFDVDALIDFLTGNEFPFHVRPRLTADEVRELVVSGRYWSDDSAGGTAARSPRR